MSTIQFRAKVQYYTDGDARREYLVIPTLNRTHCDMASFRQHPKYGSYANSDLFNAILKRIKADVFGASNWLKLDQLPAGVRVERGFLAKVTFDV